MVRIYLSGGDTDVTRRWATVADKVLLSYHYIKRKRPPLLAPKAVALKQHGMGLFLDSGAYSAFNSGAVIDLPEFIEYVRETQETWDVVASLDVIGNDEASWENYVKMREAKVRCIPVYHYGERESFLEKMVDECDYIGLGGVAQLGVGDPLFDWLDYSFKRYICDASGRPKVKVHGFAVTSVTAIQRYPWYSVDSTSWAIGKWGKVPYRIGDKFINLSFSRAHLEEINGFHYTNLPKPMQEQIRAELAKAETSPEQLAEADPEHRYYYGAYVFRELEKEGVDALLTTTPTGLFY